ncbi:hypothetical protein BDD12DRAFT_16785 [Trichophaea hybrida]|nr:hypothetical protein BDD12DRAFT_16785 [Trichophaea hybrida]
MATVVFAANNDHYRARKRIFRACQQCKRRRRRCEPPFENHDRCAGCARDGIACSLVLVANPPPSIPNPSPPQPVNPGLATISPTTSRPRFVGDLNPESVFLTSSALPQQRDLTECGVWSSQTPEIPSPHRAHTQNIPRTYLAYLDSIGAFSLPTARSREGLINIFFTSVNSILPLVHESVFRVQHADSTVSVPLLHAVLLVAGRHPAASKHLPPGASARSFAATTAEKVSALLHIGIERDRVTLTRIHALLALHSEGPGGNEAASLQLSTAIHHAYSLGLHLNRTVINREEQELWWVLWILDSLQASLCGRPVGIRREDVSVPIPTNTTTWFDASLRITDMLADVIALYRPGNTSVGWENRGNGKDGERGVGEVTSQGGGWGVEGSRGRRIGGRKWGAATASGG